MKCMTIKKEHFDMLLIYFCNFSGDPQTLNLQSGSYILVNVKRRSVVDRRYVAVSERALDDDGEVPVMFLKNVGNNKVLFKPVETDVADVHYSDIITVLHQPTVAMKGNRHFFKFKDAVEISEKLFVI